MLVYQRVYHVLGGYLFTSYWRILSRVLGNIWKYWTTAAWFVSDHFHRDIISGNYDIHHGILGAYGSILFSDQLTHSTNRKNHLHFSCKQTLDGFSKHKQTWWFSLMVPGGLPRASGVQPYLLFRWNLQKLVGWCRGHENQPLTMWKILFGTLW